MVLNKCKLGRTQSISAAYQNSSLCLEQLRGTLFKDNSYIDILSVLYFFSPKKLLGFAKHAKLITVN